MSNAKNVGSGSLQASEERKTLTLNRGGAAERQTRDSAPEVRGDRGASEGADRTMSAAMASAEELDKLIRNEFEQTALMSPPPIPGYHLCWLATNSVTDPVQRRIQLGYELVRRSELPGFDPSNGQELARYEGLVTWNEMVLAKIPEARYQAIMRYHHHYKPLEEEEATRAVIDKAAGQRGARRVTEDGEDGIGAWDKEMEEARSRAPMFD